MSIRGIADRFGDVTGDLSAWEPEDPNDLFAYFPAVADMIGDMRFALDRNHARISGTGLHPGLIDMLGAAVFAVARAEAYAGELERLAQL